MKARTRITIALAISLVVAGALALVVHSTAFRSTEYPTWDAYRDELLTEMDVSRQGVIAALDEDPALLFDAPAADPEFGNGTSIDDASSAVQQRAMDRAAARSLRWAPATFATVTVVAMAYWIGNFVILQGLTGRTIGKLLARICTVDAAGRPCGIGRATVRWLFLVVDAFPYFVPMLVGFIVTVSSRNRQRVGDLVAKTWVVSVEALGQPMSIV